MLELKKIDSQYDLVLLAKERASQLNAGDKHLVAKNNDKNTVIALREIGEGKISIKTIEDNAINKLRKPQSEPTELEDLVVYMKGLRPEYKENSKAKFRLVGRTRFPEKTFSTTPSNLTVILIWFIICISSFFFLK